LLCVGVVESTFATVERYSKRDVDVILIGGAAAETENWALAAGGSAAQSALYATRAICTILGIEEPGEVAVLLAEGDAMAEEAREP